MPAADIRSRAQFSRLKATLATAIGNIYEQELALRRLPQKTPDDQAMISALFAKRVELQDLIPTIREAEIAYLTSPLSLDRIRGALNDAIRIARSQLDRLKQIALAIESATLIAGTLRNLVTILR